MGSCCLHVFCYYHILSYSLGSFFINIWLCSCLILQFMYFHWKRLCVLIVVYVFLLLVYVFLSHTLVYVFLGAATLTEVFPCFFLSCKANARV